jgi:regulator of protease activity HflC (stomatin/prohibitin superfamily)
MKQLIKKISLVMLFSLGMSCNYGYVKSGEIGLLSDGLTGKVEKDIYREGRHSIGMRDEMIVYPVQPKTYVEKLEVITRDDLTVEVIASIRIAPIQAKIYNLHTEIGAGYYMNIVKQDFRGAIKNAFKEYPMTQVSKNFENIEKEIRTAITPKLLARYIEIDDINIDDINYNKTIMEAIQNKLVKEQEVETMKYEMNTEKKRNEIERMNAQRDAEIKLIRAKAEAESLRLVNSQITTKYIQLKAMENPNNKVIYLPIGRDGLPVLLNLDKGEERMAPIPYAKPSKTSKAEETPNE